MLHLLSTGTIRPLGRMRGASNETLLTTVTGAESPGGPLRTVRAVLKTRAGEQPLRDFPRGTLSQREVAAFRLSDHLGLDVVPPTVWRDDVHRADADGASLQAYVETDPAADPPVVLADEDAVGSDLAPVLRAVLGDGAEVVLAHALTAPVRRIALLDVLLGNADRKGGHVLAGAWRLEPGEEPVVDLHAIDNGLSFHAAPKLRTILWGFAGEPLHEDEVALVARARDDDLDGLLGDLLPQRELWALARRAAALLEEGCFPLPPEDRHVIPWPPL